MPKALRTALCGAAVCGLVAAAAHAQEAPLAQAVDQPPGQVAASLVAPDAAGIDVNNATHTGNVLTFASVTIPVAGFLVIHADEPGEPIIGHAPLHAGANQNVQVILDRNPAIGEELIAMLHQDVGMTGVFDPAIDEALIAAAGTPLIGPAGEELLAVADQPVTARFRVATTEELPAAIAGEQPPERLAAPMPEPEPAEPAAAPETPSPAPQAAPPTGAAAGY